jgi:hypothetical protein
MVTKNILEPPAFNPEFQYIIFIFDGISYYFEAMCREKFSVNRL